MPSIASAIRQARLAAGLTQQDLAALLDVSRDWVSSRERGIIRLSIQDFIRWSKACDIKPAEMLSIAMDEAEKP